MSIQISVMDTIIDILNTKFGISGSFQDDTMDIPLTSPYFKFTGNQLYQLLMCIEEAFSIYFEPEDFAENGFSTLSDIQKSVESKIHML